MAEIIQTVKIKIVGAGGNRFSRQILRFVAWVLKIKLEVKNGM